MGPDGALEQWFARTLGIDGASLGQSSVERIVAEALKRSGAADVTAYLALLETSPEEADRFMEALIVPETWFFRDEEPFTFLRRYLDQTWRPGHPGQVLRLLSAPCSTGEEPYSIAMTLLEAGLPAEGFLLDAADISGRALAAARKAVYGRGSFRQPLNGEREAFFLPASRGRRLAEAVTRTVRFRRANLAAADFFAAEAPYDVIFCRNILIYMTAAARRQLLAHLSRLLAPEGLLFTGHAEMGILQQEGFVAVCHPRAFACRRRTAAAVNAAVAGKVRPRPVGAAPAALRPEVPPGTAKASPVGAPLATAATPAGASPAAGLVPAGSPVPSGNRAPTGAPVPDVPSPAAGSRAEKKSPGSCAEALYAEALALADQGRFAEAEALCREALRRECPGADLYCLLGLIQEAARRPDEAEVCYLKALYLDPGHYESLVHLSLLYRQQGKAAKARTYLRRVETLERRPDGTDGP